MTDVIMPVFPHLIRELPACGKRHKDIGYCTRVANHNGMHIACTDDETIGVWDTGVAINLRKGQWL